MKRLVLTLALAAFGWYLGHASHLNAPSFAAVPRASFTHYAYAGEHFTRSARQTNSEVAQATNASESGTLPRFVSNDDLFRAIDAARQSVVVSAYTLSASSEIIPHLTAADARGVHVQVVLTDSGFDYALSGNAAFKAKHPSMHVVLLQRPIHLKTVVTDHGAGVFVTDRNFAGAGDLVLQLPNTYALALERAALGDPHDEPPLTVTKGSSLESEAALIDTARSTLSIETESFGSNNPVADAIERALKRGVHVHLVVASAEYNKKYSEQRYVDKLKGEGAVFNTSDDDQKLAVIDRSVGWVGSSNSTAMLSEQIDWGFTIHDPAMLNQIQDSINEDSGYAPAR